MAYKNLQEFIGALENENELVRIKTYVNPYLEIAEITDRISKTNNGGKALLFENTGYEFPVLMNAYGSEKRMCLALGVKSLNDVARDISSSDQSPWKIYRKRSGHFDHGNCGRSDHSESICQPERAL